MNKISYSIIFLFLFACRNQTKQNHESHSPVNDTASINERSNLTAPKKEIVWFENSGHEPLEEEADLFNKKMIERIIN